MLRDRYGFELSTSSQQARDAYVAGVDLTLSANHGAEEQFRRAIDCDEGLAVSHAALARTLQVLGKIPDAKAAAARAQELAARLPHRERSHVAALATMIESGSVAGLAAAKEHLATYPRDAMVLSPCTGVFGLIGFSGRAGRETELLALLDSLASAYGEDWWFTGTHAFAQVEVGEVERARATIERSLAIYPRNANGAHYRAHVYYEGGEREAGLAYITRVVAGLSEGEPAALSYQLAHRAVAAGAGPHRGGVELLPRAPASRRLHGAADQYAVGLRLVPAARGDGRRGARPRAVARAQPVRDAVVPLARHRLRRRAWRARACLRRRCGGAGHDRRARQGSGQATWWRRSRRPSAPSADRTGPSAAAQLQAVLSSHERIGGSRAQRDLIEYALVVCLLRSGRAAEARGLLQTRRSQSGANGWPIEGL